MTTFENEYCAHCNLRAAPNSIKTTGLRHARISRTACQHRRQGEAADLAGSVDSAIRSGSQGQQADTLLAGLNDVQQLQAGQIPDTDVAARSAVQAAAADDHALHRLLMAPQGPQALTLTHIPHLQSATSASQHNESCRFRKVSD